MVKNTLTLNLILIMLGFSSLDYKPSKADEKCNSMISSKTLTWSLNKIKQSNLARINEISCEDINSINKMNEEDIIITSGRKRGESLICLSNVSEDPCKHVIGIINQGYVDTTYVLSEVFSFTPKVPDKLNETVERLFLKPSSLIQ